jgi:hypothetical protein
MDKVWYTVDNLAGNEWSEWAEGFLEDGDQYETEAEAINMGEALKARGYRRHSVTKHRITARGIHHTETVWDA